MSDPQERRALEIAGALELPAWARRPGRSAANNGSAIRPGHRHCQLDATAPVVGERRRGAAGGDADFDVGFFPKIRQPRISQRIAKVGPTPMVSTRTLDGAVTCVVRLASASKIGVSPL